jgi:hypothetical protein
MAVSLSNDSLIYTRLKNTSRRLQCGLKYTRHPASEFAKSTRLDSASGTAVDVVLLVAGAFNFQH